MSRPLTIAAVQLPTLPDSGPAPDRQTARFTSAEHWLEQAGQRGADLACLGETFNVVGLDLTRTTATPLVRDALAATLNRFAPIARRHNMAIIAPVLAVLDDVLRNAALVIDARGELAGQYCKVHCIENEKALGVVPGDTWPVFDVKGARIGVQICHDNSFPESARCLTLNGAEIIFWPHIMSGWGGEFMDVLLRAPAIHNGVHVVPVCYGCPPERAWRPGMLIGRSSVIGPDATILADAGRHPGIAFAQIDLDAPRVATCFTRDGDWVWRTDMSNDRRPDTYAALTAPNLRRPPIRAGDAGGTGAFKL
ncbi:carbon-nitrogen hydrolase family protein [Horticoccus luteus]|uniref:Carbon-nitrogen hydrolase family protein n=1 Tax=Horticoccus luteus TaxID=2862869 RepID=A0A8F9TWE2_9BACT|nr:carbon-nitrogen hydrolase family protein [Horticoccus luteus]QYM80325.1 carbon-nitrogen hydrolase family protein [Horticoccus luteus]